VKNLFRFVLAFGSSAVVFVACVVGLGLSIGCAGPAAQGGATATPSGSPGGVAASGTSIYHQRCETCHGKTGEGDGRAAYLLYPKPRNFTAGVFRFKSTVDEDPPTVADIVRNIKDGIERTAMPGFAGILSEQEIQQVARYVLSLDPDYEADEEVETVAVPPRPRFDAALIAEGEHIYTMLRCAHCHGVTGHGDGPSSWGLKDSNGYPLPPADFTTGVFKAGRNPEDLYRTVWVGVPGTPMPSYQSTLAGGFPVPHVRRGTDKTWALVAFLESMVTDHQAGGIKSGGVVPVAKITDESMLTRPFAAAWDQVKPVTLSLTPLWQRKRSTKAIDVRVVQDAQRIAFCVAWSDGSVDLREGVHSATDGAALMFGLGSEVPPIEMGGAEGQGHALPVNIWHWKASRQLDANEGRRHDLAIREPGVPSDLYMFKKGDRIRGGVEESDPTYVTAWKAGNLNADPTMIGHSILEYDAAGFGTLTALPKEQQAVDGVGRWSNGEWRVVFVRDLLPGGDGDADLAHMARVPFALAVWQGSALDRDGTKLVSAWHFLEPGGR